MAAIFTAQDVPLASLPPKVYVGTFKGSPTGSTFRAVAYFDYLNAAGNNTPDFVFTSFPKLRLNLNICMGSDTFASKTLDLAAFDFLSQVAQFRSITGSDATQIEMNFSQDFSKSEGTFLVVDASSGGRPNQPQLKLDAKPNASSHGCEQ